MAEERFSDSGDDVLYLATDPDCQKLLQKQDSKEVVRLSMLITKINPRDKEQERVMLITDKAIYNVMPSNYGKCKRRIAISGVTSITTSQSSLEFVLNVPDEYDYRYKSDKRERIVQVIGELFKSLIGKELTVASVPEAALKDRVRTKSAARLIKFSALWKNKLDLQRRQSLVDDTEEEHELTTETKEEKGEEDEEELAAPTPVVSAPVHISPNTPAPPVVHHEPPQKSSPPVIASDGWQTNSSLPARPAQRAPRPHEFQLIKMVGRGCFGKVAQVKKKSNGKVYAMKILRKERITQYNQVEHTRAEREIMAMPAHPFLVGLKFAFQTKARLYLVVDFYPRGDLCRYLRIEGQFTEDIARVWTAEIALALGHLHSCNIIYRDLKPENILLHENGHVCLTDFGLAKAVKPKERTRTFCGTPEYLCPEVVNNNGHDRMVDWWTLGIFIYELVTGVTPFFGETPSDICNNVLNGELYMPATISKTCADFIISLLDRNPKTRLGAKRDVEDIKSHAFFKGVDWARVMKKEVDPGYVPKVKDAVSAMPSRVSVEVEEDEAAAMRMTMAAADPFKGFEYVASDIGEEDNVRYSLAVNPMSQPPRSTMLLNAVHPFSQKVTLARSTPAADSSSDSSTSHKALGSSSLKNLHNNSPKPPPQKEQDTASNGPAKPSAKISDAHEMLAKSLNASSSTPLSSGRPKPGSGPASPNAKAAPGHDPHPQLQPPTIASVSHRKNPSTSGITVSPTAANSVKHSSGPSSPPAPASSAPSSAPVVKPPPPRVTGAASPGGNQIPGFAGLKPTGLRPSGVTSPPLSPATSPPASPLKREGSSSQMRPKPSNSGLRPATGSFDHSHGVAPADSKRITTPRKTGGSLGNDSGIISNAVKPQGAASSAAARAASPGASYPPPGRAGTLPKPAAKAPPPRTT